MLETAAALCGGLGVTAALLALALPAPSVVIVRPLFRARQLFREVRAREAALAAGTGWPWLSLEKLFALQGLAAIVGAIAALLTTNLAALGAPGAIGAVALVRAVALARSRAVRRRRQDAVLESVRMLRQLLETGATGVQQAIAMLGERGPAALRLEFQTIASASSGRRRAWAAARERIAEPLFDLLAAAVLIQRPGGGELVPLFVELEGSVAAALEVEREAEALQVQARSAATIIVSLPIGFLVVMSMLHSPYLDAFREPAGEAFLVSMLGMMAASYAWIRRILRLPGMVRMRLSDA